MSNILRKEDMYAIQVDLFDNRGTGHKGKGLGLMLRIETDKTEGKWFHIAAQIAEKRKPSQVKRYIKNSFDQELFDYYKDAREQLALAAADGWEFSPVITTFYEKNNKQLGNLPGMMGMVWKAPEKPWTLDITIGLFNERLRLESKENNFNKKIYYAFERYKYNDNISFRRGF